MARDGEHNRIIKDLQKTVAELNHSYREQNLPVTDGSRELHSLCAQLEFLLQFDLKDKRSFFGQRKDYWDFLCQGLSRRRQEHEGVRFVASLDKLKTPVGRGRAFLRYCLVHQQLAESLQLCLLDPENLCEWYYARSPFLNPQHRAEILGTLYELDGVTFHLALYRADLDTAWPMFSETLVRPSLAGGSCPAKAVLQTHNASTGAHGWTNGIDHPTTGPHRMLSHSYPPASADLQVRSVEVEHVEGDVGDMEMKKDVEDEERKEVEEVKDVDVEENVKVEKDVEQEDEEYLEQDKKEMEDVDVEENVEVEKDMEQEDEEDLEQDKKEMEDVDVEENVEVEKDMEQEDEEDLEQDKKEMEDVDVEELKAVDVEELKDAPSTGKTTKPNGDEEPSTSLPRGTGCVLGSSPLVPGQPGRTEASVWVLLSQLQDELEQQEAASRALAARLVQEEQRHRQQEESSAQWAQLLAHEAEALRETNAFLEQMLAEVVAAGSPGMLARAREEAQRWWEVAEERGARLAEALAEVAALASRLRDCQVALAAAGQMDTLESASAPKEVVAVEEVLRRALELTRLPQEALPDPEAEGDLSTATGMAMHLATLATTAQEEAQQSRQQLQALQQEVSRLQEQLSSARQDRERWALALQRAQREALEREATRGAEQARQQELIRDMKGRLLELLREKDALWQKTEGIDTPMPSPVPHDAGLCARCRKDFRLLSRRYNCRLCQGKVCHTCSVDVGKQGRCCLLCYQQRHPQAT